MKNRTIPEFNLKKYVNILRLEMVKKMPRLAHEPPEEYRQVIKAEVEFEMEQRLKAIYKELFKEND